uniref:Uncharacterized protein n=1 Tax=Arundo donax TaxID=35708 RepID=A0A0A8YYD4_ARUDO
MHISGPGNYAAFLPKILFIRFVLRFVLDGLTFQIQAIQPLFSPKFL